MEAEGFEGEKQVYGDKMEEDMAEAKEGGES